jgi:hypothetical protein
MGRALRRLGGLLVAAAFVYLAIWESWRGGADAGLFRLLLLAGAISLGLGLVLAIVGRGAAGIVARSCPRCGRRVARGGRYCEEHFQQAINEYRDEQRRKGG